MAHDYLLYANGQTTGDITAEDIQDLHAQAVLGTGTSTESLAKLFERTFLSYKAPVTCIPIAPTAPATKYHGGVACIASMHSPQVIFVSFGSTASAILVSVCVHSMLLPYLDVMLISIIPKRNDSTVLKEGAKAVISAFKDTVGGKVSEEELYQ